MLSQATSTRTVVSRSTQPGGVFQAKVVSVDPSVLHMFRGRFGGSVNAVAPRKDANPNDRPPVHLGCVRSIGRVVLQKPWRIIL